MKFKYLRCVLDESSTDEAECRRNVGNERRVAGGIMHLVNARGLELECPRVLHNLLPLTVFMYRSETVIWKEKERSTVRLYRGLLGVMRMNNFPNALIRKMSRVTKGLMKMFSNLSPM